MGKGGLPQVPPIDDVETVTHHVAPETANHRGFYMFSEKSQPITGGVLFFVQYHLQFVSWLQITSYVGKILR
jgi:hypothetical protein